MSDFCHPSLNRRSTTPKGAAVRRIIGEAFSAATRSAFVTKATLARLLALAYEEGLLEGQSRVTADVNNGIKERETT